VRDNGASEPSLHWAQCRWLERGERWPPEPSARASATMISTCPAPRWSRRALRRDDLDEPRSRRRSCGEHNTHIGDARFTDMARAGMFNVGQLVRQSHDEDDVVLVGFGTHRGTVIAGQEHRGPGGTDRASGDRCRVRPAQRSVGKLRPDDRPAAVRRVHVHRGNYWRRCAAHARAGGWRARGDVPFRDVSVTRLLPFKLMTENRQLITHN